MALDNDFLCGHHVLPHVVLKFTEASTPRPYIRTHFPLQMVNQG